MDQVQTERDLSYYAGKSVTVVYPSPPAAFPVEAIAASIGKFLAASVSVSYVTENGYVGGTNAAATAPNDGLTVGVTPIGGALACLATAPDHFAFEFQELQFLGAVGNAPTALVSSRPHITTFDQVVDNSRPLTFVAFPQSRQLISSQMIARMFNVPATMLTDYAASGSAAAGLRRGDGDLAVIALDQILDSSGADVASGITPLLLMGQVPERSKAYPMSQKIPPLDSFVRKYPLTNDVARQAYAVNQGFSDSTVPAIAFFLPPRTPEHYSLALQIALKSALDDEAITQALADVTVSNALIPPNQITTWLYDSVNSYGPFIREVAAGF